MPWTSETAVALAIGARRQPAVVARRVRSLTEDGGAPTLEWAWSAAGLDPAAMAPARDAALALLAKAVTRGNHVLGWGDPAYPAALLTLPDPPLALWVRGRPEVLSRTAIAIVGSRAARPAAIEVARQLAADLAGCGLVVVSGLARGVDAAAHRGAVGAGATVAVFGTGIDVVYPDGHEALAASVAETGALVAEFLPGTPPRAHHFPLRNRILSGLARAVIVVEASAQSGSLITARLALEQGRDVMVVPGDVRGGANRGGHALLRDGARLVEGAADVLDELGWTARPAAVSPPDAAGPGPGLLPPILAALHESGGLRMDELAVRLGAPEAVLLQDLLDFELAGLVARDGSGRYLPAERKW